MHWHPLMLEIPGWLAGWWLWGRPSQLAPAPGRAPRPERRVTVIVPARDEAEVLPALLDDLTAMADEHRQIIVVDDHSTDGTAQAARRIAAVTVVEAPELPDGWTGKTWACHVGVEAIDDLGDDDVLVFLDADVRLAPGAIDAAVAQVDAGVDLVSVQPFHTTHLPYEQLSLYSGIVGLMGTGTGRPDHQPTGAFGPLLATTARAYRASGGHAAVGHEIAEDVALGLRYRDQGERIRILLGGNLVRFRMYPRGLRQLVEGWTKNMAAGAEAVAWHRSLLVAAWIAASGSAAMSLPVVPGNAGVAPVVGVVIYLAFVAQIRAIGAATGTFGTATAAAYPVPLVAFIALFVRSMWRLHVRRSVRWRDRTISLGRSGASP